MRAILPYLVLALGVSTLTEATQAHKTRPVASSDDCCPTSTTKDTKPATEKDHDHDKNHDHDKDQGHDNDQGHDASQKTHKTSAQKHRASNHTKHSTQASSASTRTQASTATSSANRPTATDTNRTQTSSKNTASKQATTTPSTSSKQATTTPSTSSKQAASQESSDRTATTTKQQSNPDFGHIDISLVSRSFGHVIYQNFISNPNFTFDFDALLTGLKEAAAGTESPLTEEVCMAQMTELQDQAFARLAEQNMDEANLFMTMNQKRAGVVALEPGQVHYRITHPGNGAKVTEDSTPTIQYTGRYIDGTSFGSSQNNATPLTIGLHDVIPGLRKGLVGMHEGEKRTIYVHPDQAYGTSGELLPNALLVFEVELVHSGNRDHNTAVSDAHRSSGSNTGHRQMNREDVEDISSFLSGSDSTESQTRLESINNRQNNKL